MNKISTRRGFALSRHSELVSGSSCFTKGFTLIELLVVVVIIGILAAVAVPQYQKAVAKSRYAKLKPLVKALANAEEVYYLANDKYAIDIKKLDVDWPSIPTEGNALSTGTEYIFEWGYCSLNANSVGDRVVCEDSSVPIKYARYLQHSSLHPGMQRCSAVTMTNTIAHEICKAESGLVEPTENSDYFW